MNKPKTLNEFARMQLRERAERLVRLLDKDCPDLILASEAGLVFMAGCALDPSRAAENMAARVRHMTAVNNGYCVDCGEACEMGDAVCEACEERRLQTAKEEFESHGEPWPEGAA